LILNGEVTYKKKIKLQKKNQSKFMQLVPGDEITVTKEVMKFGKMEFVGYEELLQMDFDKLAGLKPTP